MVKTFFSILLTSLLLVSSVLAQPQSSIEKYWIFLRDKKDAAGKVARVESDYLKPAAISRRLRRAAAIPPEIDAPLSEAHLQRLRALDIQLLVQSRWLNAASAFLTEKQVQEVSALPFVTTLRPVGRLLAPAQQAHRPVVEAVTIPDVRLRFRLDYGPSLGQLEVVNAVPPLEAGLKGAGVKLGIIDTGMGDLPSTHPATSLLMQEGRLIESQDFTQLPDDNARHGFSVLSVAAGFDEGQLIGPAYGAEIYHARTEYGPTETNQEEDNFVAGIEWMESQGVDVVNISLGYSTFDAGEASYTADDLDGNTGVTTIAADMAVELGMVVVASAGNEGCTSPGACWYYVTTPADGDHVITVGAVDVNGDLVGFSSRGPTADGRIKPDVAAQGAAVYLSSSGGGYASSNGTSFSSPMVAGVVALILEANPDLNPSEIRSILQTTASQADAPDNELGWGIIDAEAAVNEARGDESPIQNEQAPELRAVVFESLYPNPLIDRSTLQIDNRGLPVTAQLVVYNALGRAVYSGFNGLLSPGRHRLPIDLSRQAPGLYFYRLRAGNVIRSGALVRL